MDPERWKRVDDLLQSALDLPADQQDAFLRQACGDDLDLLQEVESLLASHREADQFLEQPLLHVDAEAPTIGDLSASSSSTSSQSLAGKVISHYRVVGALASGGMGVVYEAEDIKLGRGVALKFLPGDLSTDRVAFERLQREARAASGLDHPNICPIYELGEHDGQPFIAMQLLEGETLRAWIENSSTQDMPSRLAQILDLSIQIAHGLAAAHQNGIIHRDIKPANIFITGRGNAKILDFGLAKVVEEIHTAEHSLDATSSHVAGPIAQPSDPAGLNLNLTRTGTTLGTAYYMSPEQVRGEKLDARTDLFSFGVVLYEMVTGRRVFSGETGPAIYDSILNRTPTPVRQLNPAVPPEMERIINKALEKDRSRRYQSAHEVAGDLETLRDNTRPGSSMQRRIRLASVGVVILIALVAGFLALNRARHSPGDETATSVKPRRSVAVLGFRNLSNKSDEDWISTALAEMVGTELAAGQHLRVIPGENVAHMKLDLALPVSGGYGADTLKKIRTNLGTDVVVQGSYLASPGNNLRIDLQLQEAGSGETIGVASETGNQSQIADLVSRAGASLREQLGIAAAPGGDLEKTRAALPADPQALRLYSEALAKLQVFDALAARDLLVRAIAVDPNHALSHSLLAQSLFTLGYDEQARDEAKKAFELSHSLPRDSQLLVEGRYRELSDDFPAAIEVYRTLWKFFPDDLDHGLRLAMTQIRNGSSKDGLDTITQLRNLPEPSRSDARVDIAEANATDALGDFKRTQQVASNGAAKARAQGSRLVEAQAREREGWAWDRLGDVDKSMAAFTEARDLAEASGNLRAASIALNGTANVLYDKGDLEGARKSYEEALRIATQIGAQRNIAAFTDDIGNVLYDQGKLAEAQKYYEQGLQIDRKINDKRGIASDLGSLANVLQGMGALPGATRMQEEALQAFREIGDRRGEASTLNNLGNVLFDRGELDAAKKNFEDAMKVQQQIDYRRGRGYSLVGVASVLIAQDRLPEARTVTLESIALRKELKDESALAESRLQLARIALEEGNPSEAENLSRATAEEFDRQKAVDNGCSSNAVLARALLAQGKMKDAQAAADLAVSLCQRGQDRGARFQSIIASAAVKAKTGEPSIAFAMLEKLHAESAHGDYLSVELESSLLLGRIEMESGKTASGRSRLENLRKTAKAKAFNLIARQAETVLANVAR